MATHKLGKLKFNLSRDGLAFRMGEGKVHRLRLGKKSPDEALPPEEMDYEGENYDDGYTDGGYNGRFDNREDGYDDYADDGYETDDGYAAEDDGYADEGDYRDEPYADEGEYADDERYDDDRYDDEGYNDRYSDADAENYGGSYERDENAFLRFVDENDWVTYLLLVVLPPLGIYLLWRRRRFEPRIRWIVSAASAVWFIILLILIISGITRGNDRSVVNSRIDLTTPTPTIVGLASATPQPSAQTDIAGLLDDISATATPLAPSNNSDSTTTSTGASTVYMPATGSYYHTKPDCENIDEGVSVSTVTEDVAIARGQSKCPLCFAGQTTYYATDGGSYYHIDQHCSDMKDAHEITEAAAKEQGKTACPVCITKTQNSLSDSDLKFASSTTTDQSGISVYYTSGGRYFHTDSSCSGMTNPTKGSLLSALLAGKTACPTCAAAADNMVYATRGGTYYHSNATCSSMVGATRLTLAEAMVLGKKKCPTCWSGSSSSTSSGTKNTTASTGISSSNSDANGVYVYGTQNGKYFHTKADCSGMTNAGRYTLKAMLLAGKTACPVCCKGADATVYAAKGGTYYHSYATCSGMTDAQSGTLAEALAYGYKKCPKCWSSGSSGTTTSNTTNTNTNTNTSTNSSATSAGDYVYCTQSGKYYHTNSTCSGMTSASRVTLSAAVSAGKTACPVCASQASRTVYSTTNGTYYHAKSSCTNMTNGKARTLEAALLLGQKACPICIGASGTSNSTAENNTPGTTLVSSGTYKAGTSGIKVYATADGKYYHAKSSCSGIVNPSYITLETALNYGKTACPVCASSANNTVYAVKGGKYYHYSKTCAGSGATNGTRAEALAYGLDPCPYCVTGTKPLTSTDTYKAGTSGIKVYATVSSKYFHNDKACAGSGASHIALETALNYGKTPCPICTAGASKTVYASAGDKYFHISKTDAGSDAKAGTLAKALALGKKPCPNCIGGSESHEESDVKYAAPGSTSVYIDLDSDLLYYHLAASCPDADFSNGTKVTLKYVVDNNFWACPFCAPPTSVSD